MSNTSKAKGKRGESAVCDMLSNVFGLPFMRVFTSGSFFGGKNIGRYDQFTKQQQDLNEGDIVVPEPLNHLSIEVKNYAEFPFHALFTGKCGQLDTWIQQASHTKKPFWLLFFKITRKKTYVCHMKAYKLTTEDNMMIYQDKYYIELADNFLTNNKSHLLELKNKNMSGNSVKL